MRPDGVIFDFNGTLFYDTPLHVLAWDSIYYELAGKHVTAEMLAEQFSGLPNKAILEKMVGTGKDPSFYSFYSQKKEALYREDVQNMPGGAHLTAGAEELFDYLKLQNIPFTIASASIKENIDFFIRTFHLDHWVRPEDIIYDDGSYQNKIQMFLDASARIGVSDRLLIFEDSLSGIQSAASIPGVSLMVIEDPNLESVYSQFPCIQAKIKDFREALEILRK